MFPSQNITDEMRVCVHEAQISEAIWEEFERVVGIVPTFRPYLIDFLTLQEDHKRVSSLPVTMAEIVRAHGNLVSSLGLLMIRGYAHAQKTFTDFLSNATCFRERTLVRLRELNAEEAEHFSSLEQMHYDKSFAYRLFYNLRNYSAHHDCPITVLPMQGTRIESEFIIDLKFVLQRDTLVENWGRRQTRVKRELIEGPAEIEFLPLADEYMDAHNQMFHSVLLRRQNELADYERYVQTLKAHLRVPEGAIPLVFENFEPDGKKATVNTIGLSEDEFEIIASLHNQFSDPKS